MKSSNTEWEPTQKHGIYSNMALTVHNPDNVFGIIYITNLIVL